MGLLIINELGICLNKEQNPDNLTLRLNRQARPDNSWEKSFVSWETKG